MRVSHETIYLNLFDPARSPPSPRLTQRPRTGRAMRSPKVARQPSGRGRLRGMAPPRERPTEADDRRTPGHWEGDLVMGRRASAVATLVERSSRYLPLVAPPDGIKAQTVRPAPRDAPHQVPAQPRRSLAWDRGREMATHADLSAQTGCPVYFASFDARHRALLAERSAGTCYVHVLVDGDGEVVGRVNPVDLADGSAELGYRIAGRAAGRGLARPRCVGSGGSRPPTTA